ncbi:TetM/TetW/TetO/TetS family tetracycline resistance ribosomal protection protein [Ktedonosporobacter rubrisoli]|uniref:TetM/TetW/TetO/TetS family tetracycline resistance ribosomal protection protein n=1 Tax=Ktedonosporobacter rubrisoli TaxID=2509675 RepID=A0A4P6JIB8_KTERU|nr:TetM/TetW/TetO/TetS family tetracycline resistance ribosomal protection protein [Ktedonosporobacter rubrisoli]QBD74713.1 TetM/TetW/TetO/TetS family tetracycline resistance ribosomal protection protein [Ktedonosporobacter rubrisoli]
MQTLNIGIVAHVDAGKTSLTERVLYETHVIDEIGRVDKGNTQTDSMELEKRRGITIKASVVSFFVQDLKINLIDTPGHADFIAEVERSFSVLDGAILLISAVEGIQAQTKILLAVLMRLGIPTIIFINKIDRSGAQSTTLLKRIQEKLTAHVIPLNRAENIGTKRACVVENSLQDQAFLETCIEQLTLNDEQLLAAYVREESITGEQVAEALLKQVREAKLYPIFFGSAMTGVGVSQLLEAVVRMFPANTEGEQAPLSGVVFKLEKEATGEKIAYVRLFSGSISVRTYVRVQRKKSDGSIETYTDKLKKLHLFYEGKTVQVQTVMAGEFCKVWGLKDAKIGDVLGEWSAKIRDIHFADPQLETRIEPRHSGQEHRLYQALLDIAEEDPLIRVLKDDFHKEIYVRLFGEVQKEVIEAILKEKHGLDVQFSETSIVCIEKPKCVGQALDMMGAPDNPFYATVGFRVEPGSSGSGITYRYTPGALPLAFYRAIEETTHATLKQGLYGWEVTDIIVTLSHTGYASPVTIAGDFKNLVPLVLMEALKQAGTEVYEPLNQFELSVPVYAISKAMFRLSALRASFEQPIPQNDDTFVLTGTLPVATTENFKRELNSFTEGEGVFVVKPGGFSKMENMFPTRKRMDYNPLNRKAYLLHILRVC